MRVWIEMGPVRSGSAVGSEFHPLMRVWIEIHASISIIYCENVSPSYEGVD